MLKKSKNRLVGWKYCKIIVLKCRVIRKAFWNWIACNEVSIFQTACFPVWELDMIVNIVIFDAWMYEHFKILHKREYMGTPMARAGRAWEVICALGTVLWGYSENRVIDFREMRLLWDPAQCSHYLRSDGYLQGTLWRGFRMNFEAGIGIDLLETRGLKTLT